MYHKLGNVQDSKLEGSLYNYEIPGVVLNRGTHKAVLLVNIATGCGLKGQLSELETLYSKYRAEGLLVIGVPCNDFWRQEPRSGRDIEEYCRRSSGVTFPLAHKSRLRGPFALDVYRWLARYETPKWNYHKYLFDAHGRLVESFWPTRPPLSQKIQRTITNLLLVTQ